MQIRVCQKMCVCVYVDIYIYVGRYSKGFAMSLQVFEFEQNDVRITLQSSKCGTVFHQMWRWFEPQLQLSFTVLKHELIEF